MGSSSGPRGVHLVGSFPHYTTTDQVFRTACESLPGRLRRIPDGECEPEKRRNWMAFQYEVFMHTPQVLASGWGAPGKDLPRSEITRIMNEMPELKTGYEEFAINSYATFCKLRQEGIIPAGVRFQVCLPSPIACILLVDASFQADVEPLYEAAMFRSLTRIQTEIPHHDLAIQWDVAPDIGLIEGVKFFGKSWFSPVKQGVIDRVTNLANHVDRDVELGFHFCYGDMEHQHWKQPENTQTIVDIATAIIAKANRPMNFMQLPVPKGRDDAAYFAPLKQLEEVRGDLELYLGLVHFDDEEGTKRRIAVASEVVKEFGVATECGMGRTPADHLHSIFAIARAVSSPIA